MADSTQTARSGKADKPQKPSPPEYRGRGEYSTGCAFCAAVTKSHNQTPGWPCIPAAAPGRAGVSLKVLHNRGGHSTGAAIAYNRFLGVMGVPKTP
jgi:hypothetical protein